MTPTNTPTTKHDKTPPSRRIANELRDAITSGQLAPGTKLPSERTLAAEHRAARNTAREAVSILAAEGLIDVRHGSGAYVRTETPMVRLGASRYSRAVRAKTGMSPFRAEAAKQGKAARVDVPDISEITPPADVANRLGLEVGATVIQRVNHYFTDEEPVQIGITYIPTSIATGSPLASERNTGTGSIYGRFADLGHEITTVHEEITARMPRPDETGILQIPAGVPVIELLHTGIDQHGQPFEVTRFVLRADRNALDYLIPVDHETSQVTP